MKGGGPYVLAGGAGRGVRILHLAAPIALILAGLGFGLSAHAQEAQPRVVIAAGVACRAAPDISAPVVVQYHSGDVFHPRDESGSDTGKWYLDASRVPGALSPGCWIHGSLTAQWSDREGALLAAADRILGRRDEVPFEDFVAVVNLLEQTPAGPHAAPLVLEGSPRLQLRRLQVLDRATRAPGTWKAEVRRSPLKAAWFHSKEDVLQFFEPGGAWVVPAGAYWELHDEYSATAVGEEIAWAGATGSVPRDECDAMCVLGRLNQTYARYWALYPRGRWVNEALAEARSQMERALVTGCFEGTEEALREADAFRATLRGPTARESRAHLDLLIEIERLCGMDRIVEARAGSECYALELEDPGVLFMLGRDMQGEVLVLTQEPLDGSPVNTDGARAYLGRAEWHRQPPLRSFSWVWSETADETGTDAAIHVRFALPLWGITWEAVRNDTGLEGVVTYHDDVPEGPAPETPFTGTRVPC